MKTKQTFLCVSATQQVSTRTMHLNRIAKCCTRKSISRHLRIFSPVNYRQKVSGEMIKN